MSALEELMQSEEKASVPLPSSKKDEVITGADIGKRLAETVIGPFRRDIKAIKIKFPKAESHKDSESKS